MKTNRRRTKGSFTCSPWPFWWACFETTCWILADTDWPVACCVPALNPFYKTGKLQVRVVRAGEHKSVAQTELVCPLKAPESVAPPCFWYHPISHSAFRGVGRPGELLPSPASNKGPAAGCGAEEFLISCAHTPPPRSYIHTLARKTLSQACFQKWAAKSRVCLAELIPALCALWGPPGSNTVQCNFGSTHKVRFVSVQETWPQTKERPHNTHALSVLSIGAVTGMMSLK